MQMVVPYPRDLGVKRCHALFGFSPTTRSSLASCGMALAPPHFTFSSSGWTRTGDQFAGRQCSQCRDAHVDPDRWSGMSGRTGGLDGQERVPVAALALNLACDRRGRDGPMQVDANGPDAFHSQAATDETPPAMISEAKCFEPFASSKPWESGLTILRFEAAGKRRKRETDLL